MQEAHILKRPVSGRTSFCWSRVCPLFSLLWVAMEDYAWIKTTQAVIFIGLDIPLGYLLTRLGEYKSVLLSIAFGVIGAMGYLLLPSFLGFLASETLLALSLSTWPVALSAYSMRILEDYKIEGLIEKYFHLGDAVANFFVVACGSLGGLLYAFNKYIPYGCFLAFYLFSALFALCYLKKLDIVKLKKKEAMKSVIASIKEMKPVLPFASILFLAQFLMQPLFHYWQPLFKEKFAMGSQDMSIVFIGYSLAMSTISWGYSRMTQFSILRSNLFVVCAGLVGGLLYSLIARSVRFQFFADLFCPFFWNLQFSRNFRRGFNTK